MANCGFSEEQAKEIEANYHNLYKESLEYIEQKTEEAKKNGYVTLAFGLRLRTPLLKNASSRLTSRQMAEKRTAGNALGQSWGLLNNRAMREIIQAIDDEGYSEEILPIMQIHDAGYFLVRDNAEAILWLNKKIHKATLWNDDPIIYHDKVKLGGEMDIFYPNWSTPLTLPENVTEDELITLVQNHLEKGI